MYFLGGILSGVVCLLVSSIDLKYLKEKETIKISINNIKKYYNLLNFIIIFLVNLYLKALFFYNDILYMINLLCFLCLYICAFTDIICKNIFINIIMVFVVPIILLNVYGNYIKLATLGLISGIILYGTIYIISKLFYGKEVFGTGDIYALSLIRISTDWYTVFYIGLFTFIIAGLFYLIKLIFIKDIETFKHQEIALIPFILSSYLLLIYF